MRFKSFAKPSQIHDLRSLIEPQHGTQIEVIVAWQERILNTYNFPTGKTITVGNHHASDIYLPISDDRHFTQDFITFSEKVTVHTEKAAQELKPAQMVTVDMAGGKITVFVRWAKEVPKPVSGPWFGFTEAEALAVFSSAVIAIAFSAYVSLIMKPVDDELTKPPEEKRVARFMYAPPSAGGQAAVRKGESKKIAEKSGASAATVKKDVSKMGVLGIFGANGVRKKLDETASGQGTLQGLGEKATGGVGENQNLEGDRVGKAFENANAGGNAAIGIGGVGSKGQGIAADGGGSLSGRRSHKIKLGDESEPFNGNIDKEAIRRVISENIGQIRACYENALNREPDLAGKLILEWQIDQDGKPSNAKVKRTSLNSQLVINCVIARLNSWKFPKPPPGVIGMVDYPFSFESSIQLNGG